MCPKHWTHGITPPAFHRHVPNTGHTESLHLPSIDVSQTLITPHHSTCLHLLHIHVDERVTDLVLGICTQMYMSDDGKCAAHSGNCSYRLLFFFKSE